MVRFRSSDLRRADHIRLQQMGLHGAGNIRLAPCLPTFCSGVIAMSIKLDFQFRVISDLSENPRLFKPVPNDQLICA